MKTSVKALLICVCALALVAASIFGTMAYLTSEDTVVNTFTVGNVHIKLDEAKVDDNGDPIEGASRVDNNKYHLIPGHTYVKDPTVTVLKDSEDCYVRMIVTISFANAVSDQTLALKLDGMIVGNDSTEWDRISKTVSTDRKTITYEYRYVANGGIVNGKSGDNALPALFDKITVPSEWDNADMDALGDFTVTIVGHAIQADGFENATDPADAAWAAFDGQATHTIETAAAPESNT